MIVWRRSKDQSNDYYFCITNVSECSKKKNKNIIYTNLESAIRPSRHNESYIYWNNKNEMVNQSNPNNLVGDLNLTKSWVSQVSCVRCRRSLMVTMLFAVSMVWVKLKTCRGDQRKIRSESHTIGPVRHNESLHITKTYR